MENKIKQLRKGVFELAILGALEDRQHYGYSLVKTITGGVSISINEGTLYPILSRLAKEGLVQSQWVESSQGPPRKYYSLTPKGTETLAALCEEFDNLVAMIRQVRETVGNNDDSPESKHISVKKGESDESSLS